jgi:hypothetical protein
MAALQEIRDVTGLDYDARLGAGAGFDRNTSVPTNTYGWVRTGGGSSSLGQGGLGNCNAWTSSSSGDWGTVAALDAFWITAPDEPSRWLSPADTCNSPNRVWCVED